MAEGQEIAERINKHLTAIKRGTLRFWGHWFGRPYDNWHQVVSCTFTSEVLKLTFNEGETLHVWDGHKAIVSRKTLQIATASRVRWEWYYYGRPKTAASLYFQDFTRTVSGISPQTNVDWYTPTFEFDLSLPAVEIL
jgi:hypothetical protein